MYADSSAPRLLATWNRARGVWETTALALCGHSEPYWATWPTSGTTRAGTAYALPMSAPRTDVSGCSSLPGLLPTPNTHNFKESGQQRDWGGDLTAALSLLPTPRATDGTKGGPNQRGSSGDQMLPSAVMPLLPTPAVNDMGAGKTPEAWDEWTAKMQAAHDNGNGHGKSLSVEALRLLPTPTSGDSVGTGYAETWGELTQAEGRHRLRDAARLIGDSTPPPSPDGSTSSDDPPPPPLNPDEAAIPG